MPQKQFESGARRDGGTDQYRFDLISPIGLRRLAATYAEGAAKYGSHNWELGMPVHDLLNHVVCHVYTFLGGDRNEDHLAHACWGTLAAMHSEEQWPHLNQAHLRAPGCGLTEAIKRDLIRQQSEIAQRLLGAQHGESYL